MSDGSWSRPYHPRDHPAHLRASDQQRDAIVQVVQAAAADGRLSIPEVDTRLASVYAAKTHGDLVAVSHDLIDWRPAPSPYGAGRPSNVSSRTIAPAALLCFVIGVFGAHRFYVGKTGSGLVMLALSLSFIGLVVTGVWALVDLIILIVGGFRDGDGRPIRDWT